MRFIAALACLVVSCCALAEPVGYFTVVDGEVRIVRAQHYLAAAPSVDVFADDVIETVGNASAQFELDDGSMFRLGPGTRLALSDYKLGADKSVVAASVDVLAGWIRFAVSKIKPNSQYQIRTPTISVGIRGTEGAIDAADDEGGLSLEEGTVDVSLADDVAGAVPVRAGAGEFVQHQRGRPLRKMRGVPAAFKKRLPPAMRAKLMRHAHLLKKRGVSPRMIRAMTREEAKQMIERRQFIQRRMRMQMRKRAAQKQDR